MLILTVLRDYFLRFWGSKKSYFGLFQSSLRRYLGSIWALFSVFQLLVVFSALSMINETEIVNLKIILEYMTPNSILSFGISRSPKNIRQDFPKALYFELAYFFKRYFSPKVA